MELETQLLFAQEALKGVGCIKSTDLGKLEEKNVHFLEHGSSHLMLHGVDGRVSLMKLSWMSVYDIEEELPEDSTAEIVYSTISMTDGRHVFATYPNRADDTYESGFRPDLSSPDIIPISALWDKVDQKRALKEIAGLWSVVDQALRKEEILRKERLVPGKDKAEIIAEVDLI